MEPEDDIVPPPYALEDVAPPPGSAMSLRTPIMIHSRDDAPNHNADNSFDTTYSHGLHLGRAPQLPPDLFVGREAELNLLSDLLVPGTSPRNVVAIAAVGGLGKTQLALTFAERFHENYSSIFWLDAKAEYTLRRDLAGLADTVLEQSQSPDAMAPSEDSLIKQVNQWFSYQQNDRWLLILDNYDDPKLPGIKSTTGYDIRPYFPSRNQGSILITTRSKKLGFAKYLELKQLEDVAQSLRVLSLRAGWDLSQDSGAKDLAIRLAGFPLALATAGAYLGQTPGENSAQEYLTLYDQQWSDLLENADELIEYEDRTLFSTWNLSLDQVRQQNPAAADLMSFWAYLGSSDLVFELLQEVILSGKMFRVESLNLLAASKVVFTKAVATLQSYSLVDSSPSGYFLHPCVHDWTLHILNMDLKPEYYWDAMLCIGVNVRPLAEKDAWSKNQRLRPHATQLWKLRERQKALDDVTDVRQAYILKWIGNLWLMQKCFEKAETLQYLALAAFEKIFGRLHPNTLQLVLNLVTVKSGLKRFDQAEALCLQLIEDCKSLKSVDKTLLANAQYGLSILCSEQNRLAEAERRLSEALSSCHTESHKGNVQRQLGTILALQGKFEKAELLSKVSVENLVKGLGPDHVISQQALIERALLLVWQNRWEEGMKLQEMVLESRARLFGVDHKLTLDTAGVLAQTYAKLDGYEDLVKLMERFGGARPSIFNYLGRVFVSRGDEDGAVRAYRRMYHDRSGILTLAEGFCDGCQTQDDTGSLEAAKGLAVCHTCDNGTLLCSECHRQHESGTKPFVSCIGHSFFSITGEILLNLTTTTEILRLQD